MSVSDNTVIGQAYHTAVAKNQSTIRDGAIVKRNRTNSNSGKVIFDSTRGSAVIVSFENGRYSVN